MQAKVTTMKAEKEVQMDKNQRTQTESKQIRELMLAITITLDVNVLNLTPVKRQRLSTAEMDPDSK